MGCVVVLPILFIIHPTLFVNGLNLLELNSIKGKFCITEANRKINMSTIKYMLSFFPLTHTLKEIHIESTKCLVIRVRAPLWTPSEHLQGWQGLFKEALLPGEEHRPCKSGRAGSSPTSTICQLNDSGAGLFVSLSLSFCTKKWG